MSFSAFRPAPPCGRPCQPAVGTSVAIRGHPLPVGQRDAVRCDAPAAAHSTRAGRVPPPSSGAPERRREASDRAAPPAWPPEPPRSPLTGLGPDHREAEDPIVTCRGRALSSSPAVRPPLCNPQHARSWAASPPESATPWRCASRSLSPTWASGGSVNTQYGISLSRVLRLPPAKIVLDDPEVVEPRRA